MSANQKFGIALLSIAVLVFCVLCPAVFLLNKAVSQDTPAAAQALAQQPTALVVPTQPASPTPFIVSPTAVVYNGTTDKVVDDGYRKFRPDAQWIGDDFGPEHTLPGKVVGPAIVELKPYMGFACGSIRVNEGETLNALGGGAFWEAGSQGALIERWKHHKDEYTAHYPECASNVYDSVEAFLVANPTYAK